MTTLAALTGLIAEESSNLMTIGGLPLHPLLVHAVVVLLPLGVLGLIAVILKPEWRRHYGWLAVGILALGAVLAIAASETGEQLLSIAEVSEDHEELGKLMGMLALVNAAVGLVWFWPLRTATPTRGASVLGSGRQALVAIAALLLSVASLGMIAAVGHSGAQAVWQAKVEEAAALAAQASAAPSGTTTSYSMTQVATHSTAADCWTVINGSAYDVTAWIDRHPGGPAVIEGLCGIDGSAAFTGQHSNQGGPNAELEQFLLGPVH